MLGKLIKHEFKFTYKTMLVIYIMAIVSTLGYIFFVAERFSYSSSGPSRNETLAQIQNVLAVTFAFAYVIIVISLTILTYILMCERFYKSMYSEQGYLTHTLPVSPLSNLNARLITSIIWLLVSGIILTLSILAISSAESPYYFSDLLRSLKYSELDSAAMYAFGWHLPVLLLMLLLLILAACANALLLVFAALSLGQLANLHKIRAAIGFGVALGFLEQIIVTMIMVHVPELFSITVNVNMPYEEIRMLVRRSSRGSLLLMIGIFAVFAALYYAICAVIVKKRVNLE